MHTFKECYQWLHLLAIVEDDSAVWPAVMIDQTKVGEETNTHRLQAFMITYHEAVAVDLVKNMLISGKTITCGSVTKWQLKRNHHF